MNKKDELYMSKALKLARLGWGWTSPNPLVGAVVLDAEGNPVAEGFHEKYGEAHAEINALNLAGEKARGGTLYINLEPCCHYGKTPPCIDRIIEEGVSRLVLGMTDPNPQVAGKGIQKAKDAGIEVIENVLNRECLKLNEIFVKKYSEKTPLKRMGDEEDVANAFLFLASDDAGFITGQVLGVDGGLVI